jgi:hypothetical protein
MCALLAAGCTPPAASAPQLPPAEGVVQAVLAFNSMYPGFKGTSADSSGTVWMVDGESVPEEEDDPAVPVRVPVQVGGSGVASATIEGVYWTGTVDLAVLTEARQTSDGPASSISSELEQFTDADDFAVTDVRRESTDSVSVTAWTSDEVRPPIVFHWDEDGYWDTDSGVGGEYQWLHTVGGVKVENERDVTRVLGPGLFTDQEGHGGGRYYTDPGHTVTFHVVIGTDNCLEEIDLTDGISLPNGLRASDDPSFVSRALLANPALDGKTRLGASVAAVEKQFRKPDQNVKTGVQRVLSYDLDTGGDPWADSSYASSQFTFVGGKLRSVSYWTDE